VPIRACKRHEIGGCLESGAVSFTTVVLIIDWSIRLVMVPVLVWRPQRPTVALAWIAVITFMPWMGLVAYFLFGEARLGNRRRRRYARDVHPKVTANRPGVHRAYVIRPNIQEHQQAVVQVAETLVGMPILGGNQIELLPNAARYIDLIINDIENARNHVHLLFFIFEPDDVGRRVGEALAAATARGVQCRLLADAAGSFGFFQGYADELRSRGVHVQANLPVSPLRRTLARLDLRNHRKLAVIDGMVAYTGSHNIIRGDYGDRRAGSWQDLTARIRGPAVTQLQAVFYEDWHFETGVGLPEKDMFPEPGTPDQVPIQVVPSGPNLPHSVVRDIVIEALHSARRRVIITTPYLVPDEALLTALRLVAARGARVDIVMPRKSDKMLCDLAGRSYFAELLRAGVHLHLNRAGLLHAKTMTVDDGFAMLGSANFDIRSFFLNFELGLLFYEPGATAQLRFCQTQYINDSDEVGLETWDQRPTVHRLAQNLSMLLSPLL